jgi:hypothetical protein
VTPTTEAATKAPDPGRSRLALAAWLVLAVATSAPYLAAARQAPPGREFTGAFLYQDDFYQYLSFVEQAMRGAVLFRNKFDLRPYRPALLNLEWWTAGVFARALGGRPVAGFQVLRLLALAGLLLAAARLLSRAGLQGHRRAWGLALFATGGGLGWLRAWQGRQPWQVPDLLMGLYPFHQSLHNTHFLVGASLLLWSVVLHVEWRMGWASRWGWIAIASILGLCRPFDLATFILIAAGAAGFDAVRSGITGAAKAFDLLWLLPVLAYDGLILGLHPSFRVWSGPQNLVLGPPRSEFLWALGLPAVLAVLALRDREASRRRVVECLATWCISSAILLTTGLSFSLQFLTSLGAAILLLAAVATPPRLLPIVTLSLSPTALLLLWKAFHPWPVAFAPSDELRAASFLKDSCGPLDVTLAPIETSLRIAALTPCRVVAGHRVLTPRYPSRVAEALRFYDPPTDAAWRARYVKEVGARYVLLPAGASGWLGSAPYAPVLRLSLLEVWQATAAASTASATSSEQTSPRIRLAGR